MITHFCGGQLNYIGGGYRGDHFGDNGNRDVRRSDDHVSSMPRMDASGGQHKWGYERYPWAFPHYPNSTGFAQFGPTYQSNKRPYFPLLRSNNPLACLTCFFRQYRIMKNFHFICSSSSEQLYDQVLLLSQSVGYPP